MLVKQLVAGLELLSLAAAGPLVGHRHPVRATNGAIFSNASDSSAAVSASSPSKNTVTAISTAVKTETVSKNATSAEGAASTVALVKTLTIVPVANSTSEARGGKVGVVNTVNSVPVNTTPMSTAASALANTTTLSTTASVTSSRLVGNGTTIFANTTSSILVGAIATSPLPVSASTTLKDDNTTGSADPKTSASTLGATVVSSMTTKSSVQALSQTTDTVTSVSTTTVYFTVGAGSSASSEMEVTVTDYITKYVTVAMSAMLPLGTPSTLPMKSECAAPKTTIVTLPASMSPSLVTSAAATSNPATSSTTGSSDVANPTDTSESSHGSSAASSDGSSSSIASSGVNSASSSDSSTPTDGSSSAEETSSGDSSTAASSGFTLPGQNVPEPIFGNATATSESAPVPTTVQFCPNMDGTVWTDAQGDMHAIYCNVSFNGTVINNNGTVVPSNGTASYGNHTILAGNSTANGTNSTVNSLWRRSSTATSSPTSLAGCIAKCDALLNCVGTSYNGKTCIYYSSLASSHAAQGVQFAKVVNKATAAKSSATKATAAKSSATKATAAKSSVIKAKAATSSLVKTKAATSSSIKVYVTKTSTSLSTNTHTTTITKTYSTNTHPTTLATLSKRCVSESHTSVSASVVKNSSASVKLASTLATIGSSMTASSSAKKSSSSSKITVSSQAKAATISTAKVASSIKVVSSIKVTSSLKTSSAVKTSSSTAKTSSSSSKISSSLKTSSTSTSKPSSSSVKTSSTSTASSRATSSLKSSTSSKTSTKSSSSSSKTVSFSSVCSTATPPAPTQTGIVSGCTQYYVAKSGDYCYLIAEKYGISVDTFMAWNPAVNAPSCNNVQIDDAYCVAVGCGSAASTTLTSSTSTAGSAATTTSKTSTSTSAATSTSSAVAYKMYTGNGTVAAGWPAKSKWLDFDTLFELNTPIMQESCENNWAVPNDSATEIAELKQAIIDVASNHSVDPRFVLAIVMQESNGCVRVITTSWSVQNPGLMQTHDGAGSCNRNNVVQTPCPQSEIYQMIEDGTGGTASGDGLVQCLAESAVTDVSMYYRAARIYNGGLGGYNANDLGSGCCTLCYSSDVANRLTGWSTGTSGCTL